MTKAKAGAAKEAGFSLLELLVVLGIAAVATALALPRVQGTAARSTLEGNARRLVSVLQLAHAESLRTNTDQTITLDLDQKTYGSQSARAPQLIEGATRLALADNTFEWVGRQRRIRFRPDGGATGGVIALIDGAHEARVSIDWLTGVTTLNAVLSRP